MSSITGLGALGRGETPVQRNNIKMDIDFDDVTVFANYHEITIQGPDGPDFEALKCLIDKIYNLLGLEARRDLLVLFTNTYGVNRQFGQFAFQKILSKEPLRLSRDPVSPRFLVKLCGSDEGQVYVAIDDSESGDGPCLMKLNQESLRLIKANF